MDNAHLSSQSYDICIRRARGYCSICYTPKVISTAADAATSYGVSASFAGIADAANSVTETLCKGTTGIFAPTAAISATAATTNAANLGPGWRNNVENLTPET